MFQTTNQSSYISPKYRAVDISPKTISSWPHARKTFETLSVRNTVLSYISCGNQHAIKLILRGKSVVNLTVSPLDRGKSFSYSPIIHMYIYIYVYIHIFNNPFHGDFTACLMPVYPSVHLHGGATNDPTTWDKSHKHPGRRSARMGPLEILYIHVCLYMCVYIYIYIHMFGDR